MNSAIRTRQSATLRTWTALAFLAGALGSTGCEGDPITETTAPIAPSATVSSPQASPPPPSLPPATSADLPQSAPSSFYLLATRLLPNSPPEAGWLGLTRIDQSSDASKALAWDAAVSKANPLMRDPSGLAFRSESAEVFVGNRYGNMGPGSIARFKYSASDRSLTGSGMIEHPSLGAVVQIAFNPVSGDLFAASFLKNQVSRFTFDKGGTPTFASTYATTSGPVGVLCSPSGKTIFVTDRTNTIQQFDIASGKLLRSITSSVGNLHLLATSGKHLFVAGGTAVVRFRIDGSDNETLIEDGTMPARSAIGISFSPDGTIMFVTEHGGNQIDTFRLREDAKVADPIGALVGPSDLEGGPLTAMGVVAFPKSATPVK